MTQPAASGFWDELTQYLRDFHAALAPLTDSRAPLLGAATDSLPAGRMRFQGAGVNLTLDDGAWSGKPRPRASAIGARQGEFVVCELLPAVYCTVVCALWTGLLGTIVCGLLCAATFITVCYVLWVEGT